MLLECACQHVAKCCHKASLKSSLEVDQNLSEMCLFWNCCYDDKRKSHVNKTRAITQLVRETTRAASPSDTIPWIF
jgi:hypothetical protein